MTSAPFKRRRNFAFKYCKLYFHWDFHKFKRGVTYQDQGCRIFQASAYFYASASWLSTLFSSDFLKVSHQSKKYDYFSCFPLIFNFWPLKCSLPPHFHAYGDRLPASLISNAFHYCLKTVGQPPRRRYVITKRPGQEDHYSSRHLSSNDVFYGVNALLGETLAMLYHRGRSFALDQYASRSN